MGVSGDGGVEGIHSLGGVDHQQSDVGGFEMLARHDDGKLLGHQVGLAFAANAGGVDEAEGLSVTFDDFVDRVAGGAGDGGDDSARGAGQVIQERGFAYVGVADDGDFGFGCRLLIFDHFFAFLARGRFILAGGDAGATFQLQRFDHRVQQIVDASSVFGGDGEDSADARAGGRRLRGLAAYRCRLY